jgi:SAM-dependent methyltransferase
MEAINYARKNYKRDGLSYEQGNALQWNSPEKFDAVVSFETVEHLSCPVDFLDRVADHLHPDGLLIISAPNTLQYIKGNPPVENEHHLSEPDHPTFRSWIERRFLIESEWEQSPVFYTSPSYSPDDQKASVQHRRSWVRFANVIEDRLRRLFGRSRIIVSPKLQKQMKSYTEIMPLLPERTTDCNIFLFVCRKNVF